MTNRSPYPLKNRQPSRVAGFMKIAACLVLYVLLAKPSLAAPRFGTEDPDPPYDEILVALNLQGVGGVQVPAAIRNDVAWLAVTDVLDFLKIKNTASPGMDSIYGSFMIQQAHFVIDQKLNRIIYQGKTFELAPDAIIR